MPAPKQDQDRIDLIYNQLDNSATDNTSLRQDIERSDDFYFGRRPGPAAEGRSSVVSMDCQNVVTATAASVLQGFTTDIPAHFTPQADDDDIQAELETQAVAQVLQDNDSYLKLDGAIQSALRYSNGLMRVWTEEIETQRTQILPNATESDVAPIMAALERGGAENVKAEMLAGDEGGVRLTGTEKEQRIRIDTVNFSLTRYPKDWHDLSLDGIPFFAIEHIWSTRADLIAMGFDAEIVNNLPVYGTSDDSAGDGAVNSKLVAREESVDQHSAPVDELDRIRYWEYWGQFPTTGGATELRRVVTADKKILADEPANFIPIACGAAFPQSHRLQGISMVNKTIPIQLSKTQGQRQLEDNLDTNNRPAVVAWDMNTDDWMEGRTDAVVRAESPNARFEPVPVQDLTSGSLAYLSYLDTVRAENTGGSLDMASPEAELMKSQIGAVASQQVLANQEMIAAYVTNNLAHSLVKNLFILTHRTLRESFTGPLMLRRADQFVEVNPSEWPERTRVTLTAGMSPAERNRKSANLQAVVQQITQYLGAGIPITTLDGLHTALKDWGLSAGIDTMNQYLTDPQSEAGQQLQQQQAAQAAEQQQTQQALTAIQVQLEQQDRLLKAQDQMIDWMKAVLDSEVKEANIIARETGNIVTAELNQAQAASPPGAQGANGP